MGFSAQPVLAQYIMSLLLLLRKGRPLKIKLFKVEVLGQYPKRAIEDEILFPVTILPAHFKAVQAEIKSHDVF